MKRKIAAMLFTTLFSLLLGATGALALDSVPYVDASGNALTQDGVTAITGQTTWSNGWYVVNSTTTIGSRITVSGNVNLILADGCTLTASQGVGVPTNASLTIWGQKGGTGTLRATATGRSAGIGGSNTNNDRYGSANGSITINGGTVIASGGGNDTEGAAGIGGSAGNGYEGGNGQNITINGGTVTATGGKGTSTGGAGIGGGSGSGWDGGAGINITINGGTVTATGGNGNGEQGGGAGIGGGRAYRDRGGRQCGYAQNITITGNAKVTANGGSYAAGIGAGSYSWADGITISGNAVVNATGGSDGTGIGGHKNYSASVTITGNAQVTAMGGQSGPGIGGNTNSSVSVTISGGTITATGKNNYAAISTTPTFADAYAHITTNTNETAAYEWSGMTGSYAWKDIALKIQPVDFDVNGVTLDDPVVKGRSAQITVQGVEPKLPRTLGSDTETVTDDLSDYIVGHAITWRVNGTGATKVEKGTLYVDPGETAQKLTVSANSANRTVSVVAPFGINQQPASAALTFGYAADDTATLSVAVEGPYRNDVQYQWYKNGQVIPGATQNAYNVETGLGAGEYIYHCVVTDGNGTYLGGYQLESSKVTVTVERADSEVEQSARNVTITYGDALTLTAEVRIATLAANDNNVEFYVGDKPLGAAPVSTANGGSATLTLTHNNAAYKYLEPGTNTVTARYNGSVNLNGSESGEITITLNPKTLAAPTIINQPAKEYDGTPSLGGELPEFRFSDILPGDVVEVGYTGFAYDGINVGEHAVTVSGLKLTGRDAGYYTLAGDTTTGRGTITKYQLKNLPAQTFIYTGGTAFTRTVTTPLNESVTVSFTTSSANVGEYTHSSGDGFDTGSGSVSGNTYTAVVTDSDNYKIVGGGTLTVTAADSAITLVSNSPVTYGEALTVTATVNLARANGIQLFAAMQDQVDFYIDDTFVKSVDVAYDDDSAKDSGTATLTISALSANGLNAGNHTIRAEYGGSKNLNGNSSATIPVTVNKRTLTPVSLDGTVSRQYDNTTGVPTGLSVGFSNAAGDETPTGSATFTFTDKNVGANKTVNATGIALDSPWTANYTLSADELLNAPSSASVTPYALTLGTASFTYNAGTSFSAEVSPLGEAVSIAYTTSSADAGDYTYRAGNSGGIAGGGKTYIASITDTNYTLVGGGTLTIAQSGSTVEPSATETTITYGETLHLSAQIKLATLANQDEVEFFVGDTSLGSATVAYDNGPGTATLDVPVTRANGFVIGENTIKAVYGGGASLNGSQSDTLTVTVEQRELSVAWVPDEVTKVYDGTTGMQQTVSVTLGNNVSGDDVGAVASVAYPDANAGSGKTMVTSVELTGTHQGYYKLPGTLPTLTGSITQSAPVISLASGYDPSKVYDGTRISDPTAADWTITGATDSPVTVEWSPKEPVDAGEYTLTISIAATNNAQASSASMMVTISRKKVAPTIVLSDESYVYDGTEKKPAVTLMDGDTVIPESEYTVSYSGNTEAGTATVTVTCNDGGNYEFDACQKTFAIAQSGSTVEPSATERTIIYGETLHLSAQIKLATLANQDEVEFFVGDTSLGSATVAYDNGPGTATLDVAVTRANGFVIGENTIKAVYGGGVSLNGSQSDTITVTVEQRELSVAWVPDEVTKVYDGTTDVLQTVSVTLGNNVSGDDVGAVASVAYPDANADSGKTMVTSVELTGTHQGYYKLPGTLPTLTGSITQSAPSIAFKDDYDPSKVYDGTRISDPTAADWTITGATDSPVTVEWSPKEPVDAGEYTLTISIAATNNAQASSASMTVTISRKKVAPTIVLSDESYVYDGTEKKPGVTLMDGDTVIPESEYTVSYSGNMEAGTATVTVTCNDGGNYEFDVCTEAFLITQSDSTVILTPVSGQIVYGSSVTLEATVGREKSNGFSLLALFGLDRDLVQFYVGGEPIDTATVAYNGDSGTAKVTVPANATKHFHAGENTVTAVYGGSDNLQGNEERTSTIVVTVIPKTITPYIVAASSPVTKPYDETTDVLETLSLAFADGNIEGDDDVGAVAASYSYDSSNAGARTVTAIDIMLTGADKGNYQVSTIPVTIAGQITKGAMTAPDVEITVMKTSDSIITITPVGEQYEYYVGTSEPGDDDWQDSREFTGLQPDTEYTVYVRLKATENHSASAYATRTVRTASADGSATVNPGETLETENGDITNNGDNVDVGDTNVELPGEGDVKVNPDGSVDVPGGSVVHPGNGGPDMTLPGGGTVHPNGSVDVPNGGSVKVDDTIIDAPAGGGTFTPNEDGTVDVPGGSVVHPGNGGPDITVGDQGGKVDEDGHVTLPGGGIAHVGSMDVTVPESGGTLEQNEDGTVSIPFGSTVQQGGQSVTIPESGAVYDPATNTLTFVVYVIIDLQDGSEPVTIKAIYGRSIERPANPVRMGYDFGGWYTDADCTDGNEYDFARPVTGELRLYAEWTADIPDIPKTGDNSHIEMWLALMMLSASALLAIGQKAKREAKNRV